MIKHIWWQERFEDGRGIIISSKSKDNQYNDQKKKDKTTNNDVQNNKRKTRLGTMTSLDWFHF
jgi:hypothetical protein